MNSVLIVGAGAWGTALALQAASAGRQVTLWARDPVPILATRRSPRRFFGCRSHAFHFLRAVAPTKLVDGAKDMTD